MVREYEGKTEVEAIEKAVNDLGIGPEEFDVEILESEQGNFFKKPPVRIRVHVEDQSNITSQQEEVLNGPGGGVDKRVGAFLERCIELMGCSGEVSLVGREEDKMIFDIDSQDSSILIGKRGKTLDALQTVGNIYAGKVGNDYKGRVVVDIENYRERREESIMRSATKVAVQVSKSRSSKLLEPMNPFERRLVHMALNDFRDVMTQSEGEGLIKQIRIIYKGSNSRDV